MRRTTLMLASVLAFAATPAVATTLPEPAPVTTSAVAQDAKLEVDIDTDDDKWYLSPMWLAIGGLALLVIIMIAVMAGRGKNTTTVVK